MTGRRHLVRDVIVDAPPEVVFAALTDWPTQGQWMLGTRVWSDGSGQGVGAQLSAFTGVGRLGFLDTMEITEWEPLGWCASCTPGGSSAAPASSRCSPCPMGAAASSGARSWTCRLERSAAPGSPSWVRCSRPGSRGHCVVSPSWWAPGSWDLGPKLVRRRTTVAHVTTIMGNNVPSGPLSGAGSERGLGWRP